jgi:hypothetical protein
VIAHLITRIPVINLETSLVLRQNIFAQQIHKCRAVWTTTVIRDLWIKSCKRIINEHVWRRELIRLLIETLVILHGRLLLLIESSKETNNTALTIEETVEAKKAVQVRGN